MRASNWQAKKMLLQLVRRAQAGEDVVITNRGAPVARLSPIRKALTPKDGRGSARAILDWLTDHPLPGYARRSAKEIDTTIME